MNGYMRLKHAIILLAVDDYRRLKFKQGVKGNRVPDTVTMEEIEKFFKSQWGNALTGNRGNYIIEKLINEEYLSKKRLKHFCDYY